MTLITSLHVNQIKYREEVKEYLFTYDIWFKPDHFETKVESSPGSITMLHPKLINRDEYKEEMCKVPQETMANLHGQVGKIDNEQIGESSGLSIKDKKQVPKFYLEISVKNGRI